MFCACDRQANACLGEHNRFISSVFRPNGCVHCQNSHSAVAAHIHVSTYLYIYGLIWRKDLQVGGMRRPLPLPRWSSSEKIIISITGHQLLLLAAERLLFGAAIYCVATAEWRKWKFWWIGCSLCGALLETCDTWNTPCPNVGKSVACCQSTFAVQHFSAPFRGSFNRTKNAEL